MGMHTYLYVFKQLDQKDHLLIYSVRNELYLLHQ